MLLVWFLLTRSSSKNNKSQKAPWFIFIIISVMAFGIVLIAFRFIQFGEEPGGKYVPPKLTEEGIEPGHVER